MKNIEKNLKAIEMAPKKPVPAKTPLCPEPSSPMNNRIARGSPSSR
jgi:hypothetical protein